MAQKAAAPPSIMSWATRPHRPIALQLTAPPSIMCQAGTQHRRPLAHPPTAFTVCTPSRQGREAVGATGSGAAVLADPRKESDFRWPLATAFGGRGSLPIPVSMLRGSAGRRQAERSRPSLRRGPAQPPACPAQREERRRELEALRAQLEAERLRSQELQRRWAAERRELQEAAERERRLLADRLRCAWEKQQAQEEQQLKEREQQLRATEIRQLLRWKEAELHATQELLQQECDVALHQARELQQQLAEELRSPHRSGRAARAKLQGILSKLRREMDGEQPACIRQLQHQLELERRLFNQYIVGSWEGEPQHVESHRMSRSQDREGTLRHHRAEQGSSRPAVKDAHVQVPEMSKEDLGLSGSTSSKLLAQRSCLQQALSDLERQRQALQAQNHLLREGRSPEVRQKLQRLQQAGAKLEALSKRLEEKCRQLQEIGKKL